MHLFCSERGIIGATMVAMKVGAALFMLLAYASAVKLPSYITPCNRNAIDLNECAKRNGQAAISTIVNGDKAYKIPNMLPFKINHVELDASKTLKITMKDAEIFGLEDTELREVNFDLTNNHLKFVVFIPRANLVGTYDIKGRILILPIQGHGASNITLVGGTFNYEVDYDLKERKGETYMIIKNSRITYDTKRTYFYLENLFNGDKRLGEEMNNFINENWREVNKDIGPALTETISQIITQIFQAILKKVSYDDMFPQ